MVIAPSPIILSSATTTPPQPSFSPSPISPTTSSGTNRKKKIPSSQSVRMETRVVASSLRLFMFKPLALCAERGKAPLNCWEFAFGTIDIFPRDMKLNVFHHTLSMSDPHSSPSRFRAKKGFSVLFLSFLVPLLTPATSLAQNGDKKEKNKGLLISTNWRKWAPDPAPFLEPEETAKSFKVAPGFRVELVASHPMIKDPVFAEFDMQGRLWVCEFQSYMRDADGSKTNDPISRVQVLEDTDGDGRMDKATTFLDKVINPRSVSIVPGGALVAAGDGNLLFCEDTDGDLVADKRTPVAEYAKAAPGNIEHAENGLHYAIDNWMYNSKSSRRLQWRDGKIISEGTKSRGQWGMASDAFGRLYFNNNSNWFQTDSEIYDRLYGTPGAPGRGVRAIRTNTAMNRAYNPGMIQEDGRINGVTSVSGLAVHSSGAFGTEWEGAIFSFSPGTNTVGAFQPDAPMPATTGYQASSV